MIRGSRAAVGVTTFQSNNVLAGREFIRAYVTLIHFVEEVE